MKRLLLIAILAGVAPSASAQTFVTFPDANVAFVVGPQIASGDATNPHPAFDTIASTRGLYWGAYYPTVQPKRLTGTVTVTNGSAVVVGVGTQFLTEISTVRQNPYFDHIGVVVAAVGASHCADYGGGTGKRCFGQIASVTDDTHLVLTEPYANATEAGIAIETIYDISESAAGQNWNTDLYINMQYYDQAFGQYINYYRTGNATFQTYARKIADSWWASDSFKSGTLDMGAGDGRSPRNASVSGMILRALDGHPEMWDGINRYVRYMFNLWLKTRINDPELYYGVRDGGYMLLFATQLAKVLPDAYPLTGGGTETGGAALRAAYLADVEAQAVNYFGRLQYPDGSYRWSATDGADLWETTQVFQVGLLLQALGDLYGLSTNPTVKANIKNQITKCVTSIHAGGPFLVGSSGFGGYAFRGYNYFFYGGIAANHTAYLLGSNGLRSPAAPALSIGEIQDARALGQTLNHAYGLAYYLSGDVIYKTWGDDVFNGGYGEPSDTPVGDGLHNYAAGDVKSYNESFRTTGRYLAYRVTTPEAAPPTPPIRLRFLTDLYQPGDFLIASFRPLVSAGAQAN